MPKVIPPLTNVEVREAKPRDKQYKMFDGGGLHLLVMPSGSKYWHMKARFDGKELPLSFGVYPKISLAAARAKREAANALIVQGINPKQLKQAEKAKLSASNANNFEAVALRWHKDKSEEWKENTAQAALRRLEMDVFPHIGKLAISEIDAPTMLTVLRRVQDRPAMEVARRLGQLCSQIFRYAIAEGLAKYNPVPDLRDGLKKRIKGHHAAITPAELPEFLRQLQANEARMYMETRIAMRLMMLVFVRTSELIETPWSEIDLEHEQWIIPWHRMKMGKRKFNPRKVDHHVNMPVQGWELLRQLYILTGKNTYLFPNKRTPSKPASNGIILAALKHMGYAGKHTGHGFRALAMGIIKEKLNYRHDVVNRQLAHMSGDQYGEAYDRAEFLDERKVMMQRYADYIDAISRGNVIVPNFSKVA